MLFVIDLQYITTRKVKSGCALNPKLRPQFRESEPNTGKSVALPRQFANKFALLSASAYICCRKLRRCLKIFQKFFVTPFRHLSAIFIVK